MMGLNCCLAEKLKLMCHQTEIILRNIRRKINIWPTFSKGCS